MSLRQCFLTSFAAAFAERASRESGLSAVWRNARSWTALMLAEASGAEPEGVLREAARDCAALAGAGPCSLHGQWYTLDLCAVSPPYDAARDYWRTRTLIAIEHENGDDVETEMWKLAHWRSDLSVLVFYDFAEGDLSDRAYCGDRTLPDASKRNWLEGKLALLSSIVSSIDPAGGSRHLLLIGQRRAGDQVSWRFSVWSDGAFARPVALPGAPEK